MTAPRTPKRSCSVCMRLAGAPATRSRSRSPRPCPRPGAPGSPGGSARIGSARSVQLDRAVRAVRAPPGSAGRRQQVGHAPADVVVRRRALDCGRRPAAAQHEQVAIADARVERHRVGPRPPPSSASSARISSAASSVEMWPAEWFLIRRSSPGPSSVMRLQRRATSSGLELDAHAGGLEHGAPLRAGGGVVAEHREVGDVGVGRPGLADRARAAPSGPRGRCGRCAACAPP